jgi:hypothetical protein
MISMACSTRSACYEGRGSRHIAQAVVDAVGRGAYDLLLMDLNYRRCASGREGIDLLARAAALQAPPIVV